MRDHTMNFDLIPKGLRLLALFLMAFAIISLACPAEEFNGTTYRLGLKDARVTVPVNASKLNLTLSEKTDNITLLDKNNQSIPLNSSYLFWRGSHIYSLTFERHVSGELGYSIHLQGQQFILPLRNAGAVRIILPPRYTTGNRFLGIANPAPDEFEEDESGSVLTWYNTTQIPYIEVNYYRNNALQALTIIFGILALAGIVLLAEYYFSIRKLRAIREEEENMTEPDRSKHKS
jgi:hypothetical protein